MRGPEFSCWGINHKEKLAAVIIPNIIAVRIMPFFVATPLRHVMAVKSITDSNVILHLIRHKFANL
jgi:hypothetical protein